MKFLVLLLVIIAVAWWLQRDKPRADRPGSPPPSPGPGQGQGSEPGAGHTPAVMVACAHCGLHLPRTEALPGPDGQVFCSDLHRAAGARP